MYQGNQCTVATVGLYTSRSGQLSSMLGDKLVLNGSPMGRYTRKIFYYTRKSPMSGKVLKGGRGARFDLLRFHIGIC